MNNLEISCAVAVPKGRNCATISTSDATSHATHCATSDLDALAARVLERNNRNSHSNLNATMQLRDDKKRCLVNLIEQIAGHYKEDAQFLKEYIDDVLHDWSHDIEAALTCFRDIAEQQPFNKWK